MRLIPSGKVSSCLKGGGRGKKRGVNLSIGSREEDIFLVVVDDLSVGLDTWLASWGLDKEEEGVGGDG